ncbi:PREDICTED: uncharacterized protein LOC104757475 [Camelina sativa]|uniref:Uncharacterized protein LOC104757475 n=1 Tax=Camelina sativa TaxID=90675 RepID=A0ABM0WZS8_CAMSA|nr:PREDICTED: uncharacterized protein LOC104757475 [Camelina sativa]
MVDSGKEFLMLDSYNSIPWLIWIQLFVFVLLLLLLCLVGVFSLDTGDNSFSSSDSVPSTSGSSLSKRFLSGNPVPISHHGLGFSIQSHQVGSSQSIKGEITPAVTRRVTTTEEEAEGSLEKDSSHSLHHPCNLFRLAGSAFLKCFGIDRTTLRVGESLSLYLFFFFLSKGTLLTCARGFHFSSFTFSLVMKKNSRAPSNLLRPYGILIIT